MTTYSITGFAVDLSTDSFVRTATMEFVFSNNVAPNLSYTVLDNIPGAPPLVELTEPWAELGIDGFSSNRDFTQEPLVLLGDIVWSDGSLNETLTAIINVFDTGLSYFFPLVGDPVQVTNQTEWQTWDSQYRTATVAGQPFAPGQTFSLTQLGFSVTENDLFLDTDLDGLFNGGQGSDTLDGFGGNDTLGGDAGNDTVRGGDGDDEVKGGDGGDFVSGGIGSDTVLGGSGADTVFGEGGDDSVNGGFGNDVIGGGEGNDTLLAGDGADSITAGGGSDEVLGGDASDTILGGNGNDTIDGQRGSDSIDGGAGNDSLLGFIGIDTIDGGTGNDVVNGGQGNDILTGGDGLDTIFGGDGGDNIDAGVGADSVFAGLGADIANGGGGNDLMNGGLGNDTLNGDAGADTLDGGRGNDLLSGGAGADRFVFASGSGSDTISDVSVVDDEIALAEALWTAGSGTLTAQQVVNQFADDSGANTVFNFAGGETLTVNGVDNADDLVGILTLF